jgi:hypothetical protein
MRSSAKLFSEIVRGNGLIMPEDEVSVPLSTAPAVVSTAIASTTLP